MQTERQKVSRRHNWNKAILKNAIASLYQMINQDELLSMGTRARVTKAYPLLDEALKLW